MPIQSGILHIDMILERANPEQLAKLGKAYKCGEVGRPVQSKGVIELGKVSGPIKLTKSIILEAGETKSKWSLTSEGKCQKTTHSGQTY